jgi:hypothetical protein
VTATEPVHGTPNEVVDLMGALIDPWNDGLLQQYHLHNADYRSLSLDFPTLASLPPAPLPPMSPSGSSCAPLATPAPS